MMVSFGWVIDELWQRLSFRGDVDIWLWRLFLCADLLHKSTEANLYSASHNPLGVLKLPVSAQHAVAQLRHTGDIWDGDIQETSWVSLNSLWPPVGFRQLPYSSVIGFQKQDLEAMALTSPVLASNLGLLCLAKASYQFKRKGISLHLLLWAVVNYLKSFLIQSRNTNTFVHLR